MRRIMIKGNYFRIGGVALACVSILLILSLSIQVISAEVSFSIRSDQYVFPPSEFEETKEYPDILMMENEYLVTQLLPNRGITLWNLKSKLTDTEYLYSNPSPLPYFDELAKTYYIEFGGYYPLYPWNKRDNQPYMVKYEVLEKSGKKVLVYMYGEDIEEGAKIEEWISFEEKSAKINVKMKITNISGKKLSVKFGDRLVLEVPSEDIYLKIPADKVRIIASKGDWMGGEGEVKPWPQEWALWRNFKEHGVASLDVKNPYIAIINEQADEIFVKVWKPAEELKEVIIRSWGVGYKDAYFEFPVIYFQTISPGMELKSGDSFEFETCFFVAKGLTNFSTVSEYGVGLIELRKKNYTVGEEVSLNIKLATAALEKNVKAKITILNYSGSLIKEVSEELLGETSPDKPLSKSISFKVNDIDPGNYILQVKVISDRGELLTMQEELAFLHRPFTLNILSILATLLIIVVLIIVIILLIRRKKK
jgi:hypothetical protein